MGNLGKPSLDWAHCVDFYANIFMLLLCPHQQSAHDGWVRKEQCLLAHDIKKNNGIRALSRAHIPTTPIYVILPTNLFLDHNATVHKAFSNIIQVCVRVHTIHYDKGSVRIDHQRQHCIKLYSKGQNCDILIFYVLIWWSVHLRGILCNFYDYI